MGHSMTAPLITTLDGVSAADVEAKISFDSNEHQSLNRAWRKLMRELMRYTHLPEYDVAELRHRLQIYIAEITEVATKAELPIDVVIKTHINRIFSGIAYRMAALDDEAINILLARLKTYASRVDAESIALHIDAIFDGNAVNIALSDDDALKELLSIVQTYVVRLKKISDSEVKELKDFMKTLLAQVRDDRSHKITFSLSSAEKFRHLLLETSILSKREETLLVIDTEDDESSDDENSDYELTDIDNNQQQQYISQVLKLIAFHCDYDYVESQSVSTAWQNLLNSFSTLQIGTAIFIRRFMELRQALDALNIVLNQFGDNTDRVHPIHRLIQQYPLNLPEKSQQFVISKLHELMQVLLKVSCQSSDENLRIKCADIYSTLDYLIINLFTVSTDDMPAVMIDKEKAEHLIAPIPPLARHHQLTFCREEDFIQWMNGFIGGLLLYLAANPLADQANDRHDQIARLLEYARHLLIERRETPGITRALMFIGYAKRFQKKTGMIADLIQRQHKLLPTYEHHPKVKLHSPKRIKSKIQSQIQKRFKNCVAYQVATEFYQPARGISNENISNAVCNNIFRKAKGWAAKQGESNWLRKLVNYFKKVFTQRCTTVVVDLPEELLPREELVETTDEKKLVREISEQGLRLKRHSLDNPAFASMSLFPAEQTHSTSSTSKFDPKPQSPTGTIMLVDEKDDDDTNSDSDIFSP